MVDLPYRLIQQNEFKYKFKFEIYFKNEFDN